MSLTTQKRSIETNVNSPSFAPRCSMMTLQFPHNPQSSPCNTTDFCTPYMGPLTRAQFYLAATKRVATPSHRTARAKIKQHRDLQHICAEDPKSTEQNSARRRVSPRLAIGSFEETALRLRHRQQKARLQRLEREPVELVGAAGEVDHPDVGTSRVEGRVERVAELRSGDRCWWC